jgi:hypothetical protein
VIRSANATIALREGNKEKSFFGTGQSGERLKEPGAREFWLDTRYLHIDAVFYPFVVVEVLERLFQQLFEIILHNASLRY